MDLATPIRSVVPSIDADVYKVLAQSTKPTSARRIYQLAGTHSYSGVRTVLHRLHAHGLVDRTPAPPAALYAANRDHILWPAIEALATARSALLARMRQAVDSWTPAPLLAGLFGSTARGDGDEDSDIDLLIVTVVAKLSRIEGLAGDFAAQIERWTGNKVQTTVWTRPHVRELDADDAPILRNIRRDLVILAGDAGVLG